MYLVYSNILLVNHFNNHTIEVLNESLKYMKKMSVLNIEGCINNDLITESEDEDEDEERKRMKERKRLLDEMKMNYPNINIKI